MVHPPAVPHCVEVMCPNCGAICQVPIHDGDLDPQFFCITCWNNFEFEFVPEIEQIDAAKIDLSEDMVAHILGGQSRLKIRKI
jgi:hypothetical protein